MTVTGETIQGLIISHEKPWIFITFHGKLRVDSVVPNRLNSEI